MMKMFSVADDESVSRQNQDAAPVRLLVGYVLASLLLAGLLLWAGLFFLIQLALAAWRSMT